MSKAVIVCCRNKVESPLSDSDLQKLSSLILPDNCNPSPSRLVTNNGISLGLINPNPSVQVENCSVCLGSIFEKNDRWHQPGSNSPDGSYAIMRSNSEQLELLTDVVASRTIWYYKDDELFLAGTSQRTIVALLGSFSFNRAVIPWMLSTGTLGPELSWDSRIRLLPGDSILTLNRKSWSMSIKTNECTFHPDRRPDREHLQELTDVLRETFNSVNLDFSTWALPLSGGVDSRGILFMLGRPADLRCITWGLKSSLSQEKNDAYVARMLAQKYDLRHEYFISSLSDEPAEVVIDRFLANSEGRIDHISGYLDGFKIWDDLSRAGIQGIIRGDEGFGWSDVSSADSVRTSVGLSLLTDFSDWEQLQHLGLESQSLPESLERRADETLEMWRDRLYHQFRIPVVLAALSDPKLPYVELVNPLMSKRIIMKARSMPDHLRTNKQMFRSIVKSFDTSVKFARFSAIEDPRDFLRQPDAAEVVRKELQAQSEMNLLPSEFIEYVLARTVRAKEDGVKRKRSVTERVKPLVPKFVKKILRPLASKEMIDSYQLAFRTFIICRMNKLLETDAELLK